MSPLALLATSSSQNLVVALNLVAAFNLRAT
jgi:hypothetical protein